MLVLLIRPDFLISADGLHADWLTRSILTLSPLRWFCQTARVMSWLSNSATRGVAHCAQQGIRSIALLAELSQLMELILYILSDMCYNRDLCFFFFARSGTHAHLRPLCMHALHVHAIRCAVFVPPFWECFCQSLLFVPPRIICFAV